MRDLIEAVLLLPRLDLVLRQAAARGVEPRESVLRRALGEFSQEAGLLAALNAALIVTAFGLYYLGSETVRPWVSWGHLMAGSCLAAMLPVHICLGRRD